MFRVRNLVNTTTTTYYYYYYYYLYYYYDTHMHVHVHVAERGTSLASIRLTVSRVTGAFDIARFVSKIIYEWY